jgi:hypothetical protein
VWKFILATVGMGIVLFILGAVIGASAQSGPVDKAKGAGITFQAPATFVVPGAKRTLSKLVTMWKC